MLGSTAPIEIYSRNIKDDNISTNAYKRKSTAVWVPATADMTTTATYVLFVQIFFQIMHISILIFAKHTCAGSDTAIRDFAYIHDK